jgi:hypothetical protein
LGCNHHPTEYLYASCLESSSDGQVQTRLGRLYSWAVSSKSDR